MCFCLSHRGAHFSSLEFYIIEYGKIVVFMCATSKDGGFHLWPLRMEA